MDLKFFKVNGPWLIKLWTQSGLSIQIVKIGCRLTSCALDRCLLYRIQGRKQQNSLTGQYNFGFFPLSYWYKVTIRNFCKRLLHAVVQIQVTWQQQFNGRWVETDSVQKEASAKFYYLRPALHCRRMRRLGCRPPLSPTSQLVSFQPWSIQSNFDVRNENRHYQISWYTSFLAST